MSMREWFGLRRGRPGAVKASSGQPSSRRRRQVPLVAERLEGRTLLSRTGLKVPAMAEVASRAQAHGGNVLPATARPRGYSLREITAATAHFNTSGPGGRNKATEPRVPFQVLYTSNENPTNTFVVRPGTMLFVPILSSDDSAPILGDFPDVNDQEAVADYFFNREQLGAEFIEVVVDGEVTTIGPEYAVGAETPGLPSGGNRYTTAGVFLTPLSKGVHEVTIRARLTGEAIQAYPQYFPGGVFEFSITYRVIVSSDKTLVKPGK